MKADDSRHWHVVFTTSRAEKKVAERLQTLQVEYFLPLEKTLRIWSDRKKRVELPLIPSVVFVHTFKHELVRLYTVPGISSVLTENGQPGIVRQQEIDNLRLLINSEAIERDIPSESFAAGDEVEVIQGPLCGLFGKAVEETGHFRLLVEVHQLGTGFAVSVPKNCVRKL